MASPISPTRRWRVQPKWKSRPAATATHALLRPAYSPRSTIEPVNTGPSYRNFEIWKPVPDQSFINTAGQVTVNVRVDPALQTDHQIVLTIDGRPDGRIRAQYATVRPQEHPARYACCGRADCGPAWHEAAGNGAGYLLRAAGIGCATACRTEPATAAQTAALNPARCQCNATHQPFRWRSRRLSAAAQWRSVAPRSTALSSADTRSHGRMAVSCVDGRLCNVVEAKRRGGSRPNSRWAQHQCADRRSATAPHVSQRCGRNAVRRQPQSGARTTSHGSVDRCQLLCTR